MAAMQKLRLKLRGPQTKYGSQGEQKMSTRNWTSLIQIWYRETVEHNISPSVKYFIKMIGLIILQKNQEV